MCNTATLIGPGQAEISIHSPHQKAGTRTLFTKKINITLLPLNEKTELYVPLGNHLDIVFGVDQFHRKF